MYHRLAVGTPEIFFLWGGVAGGGGGGGGGAECILIMYGLPTISDMSAYTKLQWRKICRQAVYSNWSENLRDDASGNSSLVN